MSYSDGWSPLATSYDPLMSGSIDGTDQVPHDRAVIRALNTKYKPNKGVRGKPECTVFVGRLNPKTTEKSLHDSFSYYGSIHELRLIRDIVTGFSKCYAFIEYTKEKDALRAYRDGHKMRIDMHEVLVDFEHERQLKGWVPRRFGGGFGGKKEAGQLRFGGRDRPFKKPIIVDGSRYQRRDFGFSENSSNQERESYSHRDSGRSRDRERDRFSQRGQPQRDRDYDRGESKYRDRDNRHRQRSRSRSKSRN